MNNKMYGSGGLCLIHTNNPARDVIMTQPIFTDTIVAQATPSGRGGIAIVRVSGPQVLTILQAVLKQPLLPRQATYLPFYAEDESIIDEGIALFFPNPHSFTGENILELQGHGGPIIVDVLIQRLIQLGARIARPGEFTERAFLNGKLDLTQAEAIADLIDASSKQAARLALQSLQGHFSRMIHALNEKVIHLRMYIEAAIDFTDEEIDFLSDDKVEQDLRAIIISLVDIERNAKQGSFLREGITAVIAGEPNVGKSSLLNALSGKDLAIVTPIPGTTRDVLRDYILIDDMPVHIIDTAGLRDSQDSVEQEGIRRAYLEIEKADVILYVVDATKVSVNQIDLPSSFADRHVIIIRNKIDLSHEVEKIITADKQTCISLSAHTRAGLSLLTQHIKQIVGFNGDGAGLYLARRRHLDALLRAKQHVQASLDQLTTTCSAELMAEDLRLASKALSEITGELTADDLLGRIFSNFCVGK